MVSRSLPHSGPTVSHTVQWSSTGGRRAEYGVLYALAAAPNGLRITELGQDVLLTQPGTSRLIARENSRR
jgi:hypothetical protein